MPRQSSQGRQTSRAIAYTLDYLHRTTILPAQWLRPARSDAISRMVGTAGSGMKPAELELIADACLLVFAIDDLFDEGELASEELALRGERYIRCGAGIDDQDAGDDPLASGLSSIARRLRHGPHAEALWPLWATRVRELIEAMLAEHQRSYLMSNGGSMPDIATYLSDGRHSIGVGLVTTAAMLLIDEPGVRDGAAALRAAEEHLSIAARLANDLRSHERERAQGKLTSISILGADNVAAIRRRLHAELAAGRKMIANRPAGTDRSAGFLRRFASFIVRIYKTQEFHT